MYKLSIKITNHILPRYSFNWIEMIYKYRQHLRIKTVSRFLLTKNQFTGIFSNRWTFSTYRHTFELKPRIRVSSISDQDEAEFDSNSNRRTWNVRSPAKFLKAARKSFPSNVQLQITSIVISHRFALNLRLYVHMQNCGKKFVYKYDAYYYCRIFVEYLLFY